MRDEHGGVDERRAIDRDVRPRRNRSDEQRRSPGSRARPRRSERRQDGGSGSRGAPRASPLAAPACSRPASRLRLGLGSACPCARAARSRELDLVALLVGDDEAVLVAEGLRAPRRCLRVAMPHQRRRARPAAAPPGSLQQAQLEHRRGRRSARAASGRRGRRERRPCRDQADELAAGHLAAAARRRGLDRGDDRCGGAACQSSMFIETWTRPAARQLEPERAHAAGSRRRSRGRRRRSPAPPRAARAG